MADQGQRVDQMYPQDAELARLVEHHRDQKNPKTLNELTAYFEAKYGKLPPGYNLWFGKLSKDESFGSFLKDAGMMGLKTGAAAVGVGALTPNSASSASDVPTIPSRQIGNGMGYDPPSLPTSPVFGGDDVPTIPSRTFGNGMGTDPPSLPTSPNVGDMVWDSTVGKWVKKAVNNVADGVTGGGVDDWLKAAFAALGGLRNNGPSDEERAYQSQATRMLGQQEQRTQFQNPLYEAVTKMAHGLLPNMGNNGQPYPINGLSDVTVPTLDELIAQQRRT